MPKKALGFVIQLYGYDEFHKLFTDRQLVALTTFSDLVAEVRQQVEKDAIAAGLVDDGWNLRDMPESATGADFNFKERSGAERSGARARARARAICVYLSISVDRAAEKLTTICSWDVSRDNIRGIFARQAIPMVWDYAEGNPFSRSTGNWTAHITWITKAVETLPAGPPGRARQQDAGKPAHTRRQ